MNNTGKLLKRMLAAVLVAAMILTMIPMEFGVREQAEAATILSNPRIVPDSSMKSGQVTTWDCVWFGYYPQTEIVSDISDCGIYGKIIFNDNVCVVDSVLYNRLQNATYDVNNDTVIDGKKYRRLRADDATLHTNGYTNYYDWKNSSDYHYFRFDSLKWRVLSKNGSDALLLSDIGIDGKRYNDEDIVVAWETSAIREWLNNTFLNTAFNSSEKNAIQNTHVKNNGNNFWHLDEDYNDTIDKLFLPAESDICVYETGWLGKSSVEFYDSHALEYGFARYDNIDDEARMMKSSTYAKAMGLYLHSENTIEYCVGKCTWWLRSPGCNVDWASCIDAGGTRSYGGDTADSCLAVCPSLRLDLSYVNSYSYAGTVSSDGFCHEIAPGNFVVEASGKCGDNVYWSFSDGTLTISGSGEMDSYSFLGVTNDVPWAEYCDDIKNIVIEDGVTKVGDNAFAGLKNLESVSVGRDVSILGDRAFYSCKKLKELYFNGEKPDFTKNLTYNEDDTFYQDHTNIYYPIDNATWTKSDWLDHGGELVWIDWNPANGNVGHFDVSPEYAEWTSGKSVTATASYTNSKGLVADAGTVTWSSNVIDAVKFDVLGSSYTNYSVKLTAQKSSSVYVYATGENGMSDYIELVSPLEAGIVTLTRRSDFVGKANINGDVPCVNLQHDFYYDDIFFYN